MKQIQCIECEALLDEDFFGRNRACEMYTSRRLRCKHCEQTGRDATKATLTQRFLHKARNSYGHHARKFVREGVICERQEMTTRFGWYIQRMAHDMEHAYDNTCAYCEEPFSSMPNGVSSLTLDISDPRRDPYYLVNVEYCCETCNREKSRMNPDDWARHRLNWKKAKEAYARKMANPWANTLLAGLGKNGWVEV